MFLWTSYAFSALKNNMTIDDPIYQILLNNRLTGQQCSKTCRVFKDM